MYSAIISAVGALFLDTAENQKKNRDFELSATITYIICSQN